VSCSHAARLIILVMMTLASGCTSQKDQGTHQNLPTHILPQSLTEPLTPAPTPTAGQSAITEDSAPLYYNADDITRLTFCAEQSHTAASNPQQKPEGKYLSAQDYALHIFRQCARTQGLSDERTDRASFCMSGQFMAEYVWKNKQRGIQEKSLRDQLRDSPNPATSLIIREIYRLEDETLPQSQHRLWNDCIRNFKDRSKTPEAAS